MNSASTVCFLLSMIKFTTSFDDIYYRNFSVHSSVKQDRRYFEFGYKKLFSGLNHLESDLLEGSFMDTDPDPAVMMTGHVWGEVNVKNYRKKRDTRKSKLSQISRKTGMPGMASVSDLERLDKVNPVSKVKRDVRDTGPCNCET